MNTVVDFHSHVLPCVDDGSKSVEESLAMLALEAEHGIARVVATPHFYAHRDTPERFLERRARAEEALRSAMADQWGMPELIVGAEVHFFRDMSESESLRSLTVGDGKYIMVELPPAPWPEVVWRELRAIREKQGLAPVIAHVDRYIAPFRTHGIPQRLQELPVLVQANTEFFLKRATAGMAIRMLKKGQIHLIGSDCHNMSDRKPDMGTALQHIENKLGVEALTEILRYEQRILGEEVRLKGAE